MAKLRVLKAHLNTEPKVLYANLDGYVGFISGSIKANPWWSSVLMPIVFLFSAIVSGIALVILLYMVIVPLRREHVSMACLDRMAAFLFTPW